MSSYLEMLKRIGSNPNYTAGGTVGNPSAGIGEIGHIDMQGNVAQTGRPSVGMGTDPHNKGIFGNIDWKQGIEDLAGMSFPGGDSGGSIGGQRVGSGGPSLADFSPTNMGGMAPNPGMPLNRPRKKQDQYAGPFMPTQIWS
jgi:hypothetical protein